MSIITLRTSRVFFAAFLTLTALTACQTGGPVTPSPITDAAPDIFSRPGGVNVGTITDEPGFGQLTPGANERGGFDVDLYRWLGNHVPPTFTPVPVDLTIDERIGALTEGKVQLVVETFSITDERRKSIGFAGPYMITKQGMMVRAGDHRIRTINDLAGKTICTISGSTSLDQLNEGPLKHQITITVEKGYKGCSDRLLNEQVDAVSTDAIILEGFALNDSTRLSVVKTLTFGAQERFGVGLPRGDVAACKTMTAKLREFITSGSWDVFFSQHFPNLPHELYKPDPYNLDPCD
jgi:glutamate transport system substrate-binding protein